jgi:hypothetical protein
LPLLQLSDSLGRMSWFSKSATIPEPTPPPIDREATLREELRGIEAELAALNATMQAFRQKHSLRTDRFNRIVGMHAASAGGFAPVDREWRELVKKSDALFFRRNDILKAWSTAKMERK